MHVLDGGQVARLHGDRRRPAGSGRGSSMASRKQCPADQM